MEERDEAGWETWGQRSIGAPPACWPGLPARRAWPAGGVGGGCAPRRGSRGTSRGGADGGGAANGQGLAMEGLMGEGAGNPDRREGVPWEPRAPGRLAACPSAGLPGTSAPG